MWIVKQLRSGAFCLENQRTGDTTDQTWSMHSAAEEAAAEFNTRAGKIRAEMKARSDRAAAEQAAIAAIRPTEMLTNGNDW